MSSSAVTSGGSPGSSGPLAKHKSIIGSEGCVCSVMRTLWDLLSGWDMGPGREADTGAGAGVPEPRCSEHGLEGSGLLVATPPWSSLPAPREGATSGGRSRASKPALL